MYSSGWLYDLKYILTPDLVIVSHLFNYEAELKEKASELAIYNLWHPYFNSWIE